MTLMRGRQKMVARPNRADGVGQALRVAFRGGSCATPGDMQALLDKLR